MKLPNERIRKLTHTGKTSYTVNIPEDFINYLKWKERQKLTVKLSGKKIIIQDWN